MGNDSFSQRKIKEILVIYRPEYCKEKQSIKRGKHLKDGKIHFDYKQVENALAKRVNVQWEMIHFHKEK